MRRIYSTLVDNINNRNAYSLLTKWWKQKIAVWKLLNHSQKFFYILTHLI